MGLAVSKKNIHLSVERNQIKRQIRESFRLKKDQLQGLDIVVVVKQQIESTQPRMDMTLNKHWNHISK